MARFVDDKKFYLIFDKIQDVANSKAITSFRTSLNCSVFLTGANSKPETRLSGRYVRSRNNMVSVLQSSEKSKNGEEILNRLTYNRVYEIRRCSGSEKARYNDRKL
jgi:predicted AAA+ superfamily ATPase